MTSSASCRTWQTARPAFKKPRMTWRRAGINDGKKPMPKTARVIAFVCICLWILVARVPADPGPIGEPATGAVGLVAPPSPDLVRTRTLEWVAQRGVADKAR